MTTTLDTIIITAAETLDMDQTAAESAARTYLAQIEQIDGQEYDEDELPTEVADFILESMRQAQPDLTVTPLDLVAEAAEKVQQAEDALTVAREERNKAILNAVDAGAPIRQISIAGHIARQSIYTLLDKR